MQAVVSQKLVPSNVNITEVWLKGSGDEAGVIVPVSSGPGV